MSLIKNLFLFEQKGNIAVILATFAFTMLGFLAAVITILFSFSKSRVFAKYKNQGRLSVFFSIYYTTIITLVATFLTSILSLGKSYAPQILHISLMLTVDNIIQIALLTAIIINLSHKAIGE